MRQLVLLNLIATVTISCAPGDDSIFVPPEATSTVSGRINFSSANGQNFIEVTEALPVAEGDVDADCPFSVNPRDIPYELETEDVLIFNAGRGDEEERTTRISSPEEDIDIAGVDSAVFGSWAFPPGEEDSEGVTRDFAITIAAETITYELTCRGI